MDDQRPPRDRRSLRTTRLSLILFDIDGTLLLSGGAGVRAMSKTFEALFGVRDAFAGISIGGIFRSRTIRMAWPDAGSTWILFGWL